MIKAVLFDLDDTLYPQASWLSGAWAAVADAVPSTVDRQSFLDVLLDVASGGSDRGHIIDRALALVDANVDLDPLVAAFRAYAPAFLEPYPAAPRIVASVRERVPVALVTDGDVAIQGAKLRSLNLEAAFDVVVLSDELGRNRRKPDPAPFWAAAERLGVDASCCVMVGDRPDKDVRGGRRAGLLGTVRVRTGEYASQPEEEGCLATVDSLDEAGEWLFARLGSERRHSGSKPS